LEVIEMEERRRYKRYKADVEVEYDVDNGCAIHCRTHTVNISEGGVAVPLNKAVKPGKQIKLSIRLPCKNHEEEKEIRAIGKVVWKKPIDENLADEANAGIKFIGLYENGRDILGGYLQTISGAAA